MILVRPGHAAGKLKKGDLCSVGTAPRDYGNPLCIPVDYLWRAVYV
jgi:hypothetical protein